jgi:hypothetical protein
MNRRIQKIDTTKYKIHHRFGTRPVEELIVDSVVNLCNSKMVLTTTDGSTYNILGSVMEDRNEN